MSRWLAEMMPTVTVPPRPNGLPIAITQSPTRILPESPKVTAGSGFLGSTLSRARSVFVSWPKTLSTLSLVPSVKLTMISSAPSITWLLVTTRPAGSMTKPEPSELTLRGRPPARSSLKKSSKNSSNGRAFGTGPAGRALGRPLSVWLVEMLTTASCRPSATSATESGPRAKLGVASSGAPARLQHEAGRHRGSERRMLGATPKWPVTVPRCGIDRILPARSPLKPGGGVILAEIG